MIQISFKEGIDKVPEAFMEYLEANSNLLLATAYHHYLSKGRGLLWIDWINQLPVATRISEVPVMYCTPTSRLTRALFPKGMNEDVRRLVREYDPEKTIVIRWSDGEMVRTRTIMLFPATPAEAFERLKGQLCEFELNVSMAGNNGTK